MQAARNANDDLQRMLNNAVFKILFFLWTLMIIASIIMVSFAVYVGLNNNKRLDDISIKLDSANAFDFNAFSSTPCRTCDGSELIVKDGTPIVVQPTVSGFSQFPDGIKTPCFESSVNEFHIRSQAQISSLGGMTVSGRTMLQNPQGLAVSKIEMDCLNTAPCLLPNDFCSTNFNSATPHGPIYRLTRSSVGSPGTTLEHICVCILDWDPVSQTTQTLPYCTEPLKNE